MLGYVLPDKGELKVREYEIYTGYYCGICKYIGRTYGQLPRMVLSYDATFIALMLASLDPAPDEPRQEHCVVHHIKRKTVISNRAIEYAGDLMLILAWYKLQDDAQDEGKLSAKVGLASMRGIWRKLQTKHPDLCRMIGERLAALNQLEREHCPSIDRVAEDFAQVMAQIFRDGLTFLFGPQDAASEPEERPDSASGLDDQAPAPQDAAGETAEHPGSAASSDDSVSDLQDAPGKSEEHPDSTTGSDDSASAPQDTPAESAESSDHTAEKSANLHETFANVGYHLGKWIYLIDAVDDIEENLESGSYNPLLYRFQYRFGPEDTKSSENLKNPENTKNKNGFHAKSPEAGSNCASRTEPEEPKDPKDTKTPEALDASGPESPEDFRARIDEQLRFNLYHYLAVISESLETLDIRKNSGIIENVIYFGLNRKTEEILKRITPEKHRHGQL